MRLHMHPISVLENIWKRLFLLLIPLIRGVAFIFSPEGFRAWLSGAWLDLLVILFILTASYINWRCKTYQVEANQLIIRTGVLIRRESCIPKKAIATLSESIPFYMRPFRAVRVYVDTDGGLAQRVDVKLTVREKDMPVLQQLQDAKPVAPFLKRGYSPRWYEVAFMSICVSSALGSAVYAALFIRQAGKIFGEDILELLRFRLEHAAEYLIFIPQTAAILAIVILGLWFLGFMRNYLYYMKFSVYRQGDRLMLRHGLFVRSESVCRVNHINFIDRRQNLLSRMFRLNMVFIQCTGYGKVQQKMAAVIPAATNKATRIYLKLLLPEFQETPVQIRPMRRSAVRYLWSPLAGITAVIAVFYFILPWLIPWLLPILSPTIAAFGVNLGAVWGELIYFLGFMAVLPFIWMFILRLAGHGSAGISVSETTLTLCYTKGFFIHTVIIPREKLNYVSFRRSIFQKASGTCDLIFYTYSEYGHRHRVVSLPYEKAKTYLATQTDFPVL